MSKGKLKKILIAEDNTNLRKLLVKMINQIGYSNIREAHNGLEAWEYIMANQVDLVITDWELSNIDGLGLLSKIRNCRTDGIYKTPVLMISINDNMEIINEALKLKINGYIIKPVSIEVMKKKIHDTIGVANE